MNNGRGSGGAELEVESEIGHAIKMKLITFAPQGWAKGWRAKKAARCS